MRANHGKWSGETHSWSWLICNQARSYRRRHLSSPLPSPHLFSPPYLLSACLPVCLCSCYLSPILVRRLQTLHDSVCLIFAHLVLVQEIMMEPGAMVHANEGVAAGGVPAECEIDDITAGALTTTMHRCSARCVDRRLCRRPSALVSIPGSVVIDWSRHGVVGARGSTVWKIQAPTLRHVSAHAIRAGFVRERASSDCTTRTPLKSRNPCHSRRFSRPRSFLSIWLAITA